MCAARSCPRFGILAVLGAVVLAGQGQGQTISLLVNTWTDNPNGVEAMEPGDLFYYQIGVDVVDDGSNFGLATIVYDITGVESVAEGYQLSPLTPAAAGYDEAPGGIPGVLNDVTDPLFLFAGAARSGFAEYRGGWGFETGGVPTGGDVTTISGSIIGAGLATPLSWNADVDYYSSPGLQPGARLGVGHGVYTFPEPWTTWPAGAPAPTGGDPALYGLQGGFGQDLTDPDNVVEGDGTWLMQEGVIETSGWRARTYHFDIDPVGGAVYSPTVDYSQDAGGGFRIILDLGDMAGASFAFTLLSPSDFDRDGDVDLNDFATFALCYNGAEVTVPPPGCAPADFEACDLEGDGDVELNDFASFALAYTG